MTRAKKLNVTMERVGGMSANIGEDGTMEKILQNKTTKVKVYPFHGKNSKPLLILAAEIYEATKH